MAEVKLTTNMYDDFRYSGVTCSSTPTSEHKLFFSSLVLFMGIILGDNAVLHLENEPK